MAEDPFFRSLRVLRDLLKPPAKDVAASPTATTADGTEDNVESPTIRAAQRRQLSDNPNQQREAVEAPRQNDDDNELKLKELQEKLREVDTTARKERALRKSIERAFEDLTAHRKVLTEELENASSKCKSLEDEITQLRKEKRQERLSFEEKTNKQLEEMDSVLEAKQSALSQRDSMEARMLGAEKLVEELKVELANLKKSMKEQEGLHKETDQSLKQCYDSANAELEKSHTKIQTLTNDLSEARKELEESQTLLREVTEQQNSESEKEEGGKERDDHTEKQLESLKNEVARLQSQLNSSSAESEKSQKILDELKTKLSAQGTDNAAAEPDTTLRQEVDRLKNELKKAKDEAETSKNALDTLKAQSPEKQSSTTETAVKSDGNEKSSEATEHVQEQLSKTKAVLQENKKLVKLLQGKVQRLEENDALTKQQLHDQQVQNQEQHNLLTTTMDEAESLKAQLASAAEELAFVRERNQELEAALSQDDEDEDDDDDSASGRKRGRSYDEAEESDDDEVEVIEAEVVDEPSAKKAKGEGDYTTDDEEDVEM